MGSKVGYFTGLCHRDGHEVTYACISLSFVRKWSKTGCDQLLYIENYYINTTNYSKVNTTL